MDLLNGRIKPLYLKYLSAAFGSALISCIYGMVDMAMVGQYQGPDGTAALAVVAPVWNIIYSLGLLMGIGGSALFSAARGRGDQGGRPGGQAVAGPAFEEGERGQTYCEQARDDRREVPVGAGPHLQESDEDVQDEDADDNGLRLRCLQAGGQGERGRARGRRRGSWVP